MNLKCVLAASVLSVASLLLADDEHLASLKVGDEVYTNVTVTEVTMTDIYFTHSRGMGNAKLKDLTPELQRHFHYDPAKAAAKQSQQAQANVLYRQAARTAPPPHQQQQPAEQSPQPQMEDEANGIPPHPLYARSFLNRPAPELVVEKWLTGEPDRNGKFVLLDFWATWCGPCRRSIPELNGFRARFNDRLVVIGLSDEPEEAVRRMKEPRIDYTIAIDTQHRTESEVGVKGIPHTLLIDPKGIVRFEGMPGYLSERNLEKLLAKYSR